MKKNLERGHFREEKPGKRIPGNKNFKKEQQEKSEEKKVGKK